MADVATAQAMVNYYTERPPQIRGRTVYVQFSNHVELKTETSAQVGGIVCIVFMDLSFSFLLCLIELQLKEHMGVLHDLFWLRPLLFTFKFS